MAYGAEEKRSGGSDERVPLIRVLWAGLLAVALAVALNLVVRTLAVATVVSPEFPPLDVAPTVLFTAVGVTAAAAVFAGVARRSPRPVRTFRRIALAALLISLVPNALLLFADAPPLPGISSAAILVLAAEHVVAWAVSVGLLTTLPFRKLGHRPDP